MKFPPGYGYPSRDNWEKINAENDPARKITLLDKIAFLLPVWFLILFAGVLWCLH